MFDLGLKKTLDYDKNKYKLAVKSLESIKKDFYWDYGINIFQNIHLKDVIDNEIANLKRDKNGLILKFENIENIESIKRQLEDLLIKEHERVVKNNPKLYGDDREFILGLLPRKSKSKMQLKHIIANNITKGSHFEKSSKLEYGYQGIYKITLPELVEASSSSAKKGWYTLSLGITGYAMTSGTKKKLKEINARITIHEKGIQIHGGGPNGSNLRFKWESILDAEYKGGLIILKFVDGSHILIQWLRFFSSKYQIEILAELINERKKGIVEEGWD